MMYFTFDFGEWASRLARALRERAAAGVRVRLMVDEYGWVLDAPQNALHNQRLMSFLRQGGVHVDVFRPQGFGLSQMNRLHCKICAIDGQLAFVGGSNIGDGYLPINDHNLRLDGNLGHAFHDVYDYVRCFTPSGSDQPRPDLHLSRLFAGDAQLRLTVPRQRCDIRRALLDLILDADRAVYIRQWYFLPDREILHALCSQARRGVGVCMLLSHRTRVPVVDVANYIHGHQLARAGGQVYRYQDRFMHAKVAWNDHGQVLFGSANLDQQALRSNFECSLVIQNGALAERLSRAFEADRARALRQTPETFSRRSLAARALSYACNLAAPWL